MQSYLILFDPMDCSMPRLPAPLHLQKFAEVHVHCVGDAIQHLILWCHLLLLPAIFPSIRDFSNESALHIRWPKYWSFNISPTSVYSGFISLKIGLISLLSKGLSGVFSSPTVQRHQFFSTWHSLQPSSQNCTDLWWQSDVSAFQHIV